MIKRIKKATQFEIIIYFMKSFSTVVKRKPQGIIKIEKYIFVHYLTPLLFYLYH